MTLRRRVLTAVCVVLACTPTAVSGCASSARPVSDPRPGAARPTRPSLDVAGYLVPWDPRSRVAAGAGVLAEVSPVWYEPTNTGGVGYASEEARSSVPELTADATAHGVLLAPSISNFRDGRWDGALIAALVSDPGRRSAHVAAIVNLVRSRHWPAIDIDYESLPATARHNYSAFVAELAEALHRVPARLSVTLHAKTAEPGDWPGAMAQDWHAIGAAADEVRVMAYDYSYAGSRPGPIAPVSWVDRVLKLATRLIPTDRIVLGLPTYGYDWPAGATGRPEQWADVQTIVRDHGGPQRWDAASSAPWLRYTDGQGLAHTVWYENTRSLAAKLNLVRRYGLTHVVLWHLGGEDPGIWSTLRAAR